MHNYLLTIIIPTYNYGQYILNCLYSIPVTGNLEIIVIDDGSTDNTRSIVADYIKQNKSCRYFYKKNGGSSSARNFGISKAKSDFLMFLDSDDSVETKSIEKLLTIMNNGAFTQENLIIGNHFSKNFEKRKLVKQYLTSGLKSNYIYDYLIAKKIKMLSGALVFPKKFFRITNYPESYKSSEDIPVNIAALFFLNPIYLNLPLMTYNHHPDSLRHSGLGDDNYNVDEYVNYCFKAPLAFASAKEKKDILRIKKLFLSQKLLSLSRSFFIKKKYNLSTDYFNKALGKNFINITKLSYLRKYIAAFIAILRLHFFTVLKREESFLKISHHMNFDEFFLIQGNVVRQVDNRQTIFYSLNKLSFFIKKHKFPSLNEILKSFLSLKYPIFGAKNEYIALSFLKKNKINSLTPLAYGSSGFFFKSSFLITKPMENVEQLDNFFKKTKSLALKKQILIELAKIIRIIQSLGMIHRDLYLCHFWIDLKKLKKNEIKIYIIDLHRAVFKSKLSQNHKMKELSDFIFSLELVASNLVLFFIDEFDKKFYINNKVNIDNRLNYLKKRYQKNLGKK